MVERKFRFLVADTTAFINKIQLQDYAENIYTVPDVLNEVKNKKQIRRLVVLPFELKVQEPDADCLRYVTNFAKKTGDYASLSSIDLKVIALTYELEKKHVGTEHLRSEPIVSRIIASKTKPEEFVDEGALVGFYNPKKHGSEVRSMSSASGGSEECSSDNQCEEESGDVYNENLNEEEKAVNKNEKCNKIMGNGEIECDADGVRENTSSVLDSELAEHFQQLSTEVDGLNMEKILISKNDDSSDEYFEESEESDESGNNTWITPSNIHKVIEDFRGEAEEKEVIVACMSTDYALQNVLKQINLNIVALDGKVIRHVRTYILRCYACFRKTSVMTKVFCPYCGNKTLKRVAVSLDENGQQVIHINTRRPLTCKFKNQSLPRPRGGKHSCNPILAEDQPIPKQMPSRVAKTKTNALDENYIAGYSPFVVRDVDSKSALLRSKGNIKQWARNNVYEESRRKQRYNRLVK